MFTVERIKQHKQDRRTMKEILEQWNGKFEIDGEIAVNLDDLKVKDGDEFHVKLLSKRREVSDDNMQRR